MGSITDEGVRAEALGVLRGFRAELYDCLTGRPDALFELCDALLVRTGRSRPWSTLPWSRSTAAGTAR